jgi:hypothetical protein
MSYTNPYQEFTIGTPFNLAGKIVSYSPISSTQYSIKLENYDQWTTTSYIGQDGNQYQLNDDSFQTFPLTLGDATARFTFFGIDYDTIYIGSNGYITFTGGDTTGTATITNHFNQPRLSMFFNQFKPSQNGMFSLYGTSSSGKNRTITVTYYNLTEPDLNNQNYVQIILYLNNYTTVSKRGRTNNPSHQYTNNYTTVSIIITNGSFTKFGTTDISETITNISKLTHCYSFGPTYYNTITDLSGAFQNAINLVLAPEIIPQSATNLSYMFYGTTLFNSVNVLNWDLTNVENINYVFLKASAFNRNIGNWNFTNADLKKWKFIYYQATAYNQELSGWIYDRITNLF